MPVARRRVQRIGIAALSVTAVEVAIPAAIPNSPAGANKSSGEVFGYTSGEYYPGWYADNCIDAVLQDSNLPTITNVAYSFDYVSGHQCGGSTGAAMQTNWIAIDAQGFKNGSYCGATGFATNPSTTSSFAVAGNECGYVQGDSYETKAYGQWWTDVGGTWEYGPESYTTAGETPP
jgi:hypothetical protein